MNPNPFLKAACRRQPLAVHDYRDLVRQNHARQRLTGHTAGGGGGPVQCCDRICCCGQMSHAGPGYSS